ncbi:orotidine-5'-phosphate decarboxylase [Gulosibacter sp. 10]|uniref:orotidine-5'-phosphate decarboxylase n=1 Tax=Gulosibacter sp. 10 TaxID=1255570 RepID=UPI00097ED247|nr:orotidine-5'-phosphate decarboxylase [Gulosibacter sp. 10]SJM53800.1 Orotidine 5'-phosphate decarboxylase [Gulosibacter sp. 10]
MITSTIPIVDPRPFGVRLAETMDEYGHLCVGIDPHTYLLEQWGLPVSAVGAHEFGLRIIEKLRGRVGIVKPQVAFYERFGANGFKVLEDVFAAAREAGLIVIADVKRGDVGSTLDAYAEAWLTPGMPLEADAMTINPYQGFDTFRKPLDMTESYGKGLFVLAATSNPESASVQTARRVRGSQEGRTVAGGIAARAAQWNREHSAGREQGSVGVVIGATVDLDLLDIDTEDLAAEPNTPILAPGFGHQGAEFADVRRIFGKSAENVIVTSSRGMLENGLDGLDRAIDTQLATLKTAFA